jgi:hypothetical protein
VVERVPQVDSRRRLLGAAALVFIVAVTALSIPGSGVEALAPMVVVERLVFAAGWAALYLAAGVGLGRLLRPLWRGAMDELAIQVGVGCGLMLGISHLLGWLGLLGGASGPWVGLGVVLAFAAVAGHEAVGVLRGKGIELRVSGLGVLSGVGVALLVVAACSPPGALWRSEFGAYDVLSYHLQLPREWLAGGRLEPLAHNVYSYLPGYMEAAFMHVGAMSFARGEDGLIGGEGDRLVACQLVHVGYSLLAAWLTARATRRVAGDAAGPVAFGLVVLTPWVVVTGSMAYNEMAVCAMLACGLLAASETGLAAWKRGLVVGLLAGIAASAKPTGLFFVGVPLGLLLLGLGRVREWPALVGAGAAAGIAVMLPWLWRNFDSSGNPVFPFLASWFANDQGGTGHWTAEQVARYAAAHRFDGGVLERLKLLVMPEEGGGWMAHRGMLHSQWGLLFPMILLGAAGLLVRRGRELLPLPLLLIAAGLLAQIVLWLSVTHLQSRFLLPLVVPGAVLLAAAVVSLGERARKGAVLIAVIPLVVQGAYAVSVFMGEPASAAGNPNHMLAVGPTLRTGEFFRDAPREQIAAAVSQGSPELFVNLGLPPEAKVMLLGDATPLFYRRSVVYRTTYDASPLSGLDPHEWSRVMLAMGVDAVVVNVSEIARLEVSGWNAPGITPERVLAWMRGHSVPIADPSRWQEYGVFVVRPIIEGSGSVP